MLEVRTDTPIFLQRARLQALGNEERPSPSDTPRSWIRNDLSVYAENTDSDNDCKFTTESDAPMNWQMILHGYRSFFLCKEEKQLMDLYNRKIFKAAEPSRLVVIEGPIGSGKSRLAETIRHTVEVKNSGYFLVGRFDPIKSNPPKPYAAFVMAIEAFTAAVLMRGEADNILDECASLSVEDIDILLGVVPSLGHLFNRRETPVEDIHRPSGHDRLGRFIRVFRSFLRCISSARRPIVIFLNGMQWSDPCSCDLLDGLTRDSDVGGLLCITTIDTNIRSGNYINKSWADVLRNEKVATIQLKILDRRQVRNFLAHLSGMSPTTTALDEFGEVLYNRTQGNSLFMAVFLEWLMQSDAVRKHEGKWSFSSEAAQSLLLVQDATSTLLPLFGILPSQESHQLSELLKVCACMGSEFDLRLIECVLECRVGELVEEATSKGYFTKRLNGYTFSHDWFQQAAYELIHAEERNAFHVEIGRRLWRSMASNDDFQAHLYSILSQFSRGKHLIKSENECLGLASLCMQAGQKAAKASAFRAAVGYLELGIFFLTNIGDEKSGWKQDYDLTLALYNAAAEMNLVTSDFERSERLVHEVILHAKSPLDRVQANGTLISILGAVSKQKEAIDVGLKVLEELGERFPRRGHTLHILVELFTVKRMIRGRSDEQLMRIEPLTDPMKHSCLQIISLIYLHCLQNQPDLGALVGLRFFKISLKYGLSPFSSPAFAVYGMICLEMKDIDAAHRFGRLSLKLLDLYGMVEYLPRVYAGHYGVIDSWKRPLKDSLQPLLQAHQIGLQTGDREFAFLCSNCYFIHAFHSGVLLDDLVSKWRSIEGEMAASRQDSLLEMALPYLQNILLLMNSSRQEALTFRGEIMDMVCEHEIAFKS
jgi:predicted ATPase